LADDGSVRSVGPTWAVSGSVAIRPERSPFGRRAAGDEDRPRVDVLVTRRLYLVGVSQNASASSASLSKQLLLRARDVLDGASVPTAAGLPFLGESPR